MGNGNKSSPCTQRNELNMISAQISASVVDGVHAVITLNVPKKKGLWPAIMQTLDNHSIEVVSATLCTNGETDFHCMHCKLDEGSGLESVDIENLLDDICMTELNIKPWRVLEPIAAL